MSQLHKRAIVFIHDLLAIPIAWLGAYWLRFNLTPIPPSILHIAISILPIVILFQEVTYLFFGLYRGIWRFASIPDVIRIVKAVLSNAVLITLGLLFVTRMENVPRSVIPLYCLLLIAILSGSRMVYRCWVHYRQNNSLQAKRVLIIGAGNAGESLIRDLLHDVNQHYKPVAIIDNDLAKRGSEIQAIRVLGDFADISKIVKDYNVELIFIALPSASSKQIREIVASCKETGLPVRIVPTLQDLASGKVNISAVREVSIEDLLGRDPVSLNWEMIRADLKNKIVLVTGGGGSIGSELCRQVAILEPAALILLDNSEYNLYSVEMELKNKFPQINLFCYLVDVTDAVAVKMVFVQHRPHAVFHAAAYKHVPMLETQLRAAVRNNILGTWIVAEQSIEHRVKQFTLISTDKAVNPVNIMGASKRAAEVICQSLSAYSDTHFVTVRFGNVLDSAGSVVPLFRRQIAAGGPVTVTHPEIIRFFMTIPEAAQLILQATAIGKGGEIFVLDMGEPIKISYLAEQMIQLAGLKVGEDIEITYTGLRPGEKLYEELFHESEQLMSTGYPKIFQARSNAWSRKDLFAVIERLYLACEANDYTVLQKCLNDLALNGETKLQANYVDDQLSVLTN